MKKSKIGLYIVLGVIIAYAAIIPFYTIFTAPTTPKPQVERVYCIDTVDVVVALPSKVPQISTLITAMIQVESKGNDSAYCVSENAAGCLQIRPIMIAEVNRILKRNRVGDTYTLQDRWSRKKSIEILNIYKDYYRLDTFEKVARCWNGGPAGMSYNATEGYWSKVQNEMT